MFSLRASIDFHIFVLFCYRWLSQHLLPPFGLPFRSILASAKECRRRVFSPFGPRKSCFRLRLLSILACSAFPENASFHKNSGLRACDPFSTVSDAFWLHFRCFRMAFGSIFGAFGRLWAPFREGFGGVRAPFRASTRCPALSPGKGRHLDGQCSCSGPLTRQPRQARPDRPGPGPEHVRTLSHRSETPRDQREGGGGPPQGGILLAS